MCLLVTNNSGIGEVWPGSPQRSKMESFATKLPTKHRLGILELRNRVTKPVYAK